MSVDRSMAWRGNAGFYGNQPLLRAPLFFFSSVPTLFFNTGGALGIEGDRGIASICSITKIAFDWQISRR